MTSELMKLTVSLNTGKLSMTCQPVTSQHQVSGGMEVHQHQQHPLQLEPNNLAAITTDRQMRTTTTRIWNQDARTTAFKESFRINLEQCTQ